MGKKRTKHQKMYKMKGCSKKTRKNHLGGKSNLYLAYPSSNEATVNNPFFAYTGKGGSNLASGVYPSQGPPAKGFDFLNIQSKRGGGCGCGMKLPFMSGGCCPMCNAGANLMTGGKKTHKAGCKCSVCKMIMKGGLGNNGIPYPNGLVGQPYNINTNLPGTRLPGDANYYPPNQYDDQPGYSNATGANRPYSIGGGRRRKGQKAGGFSNFMFQDLVNLGRQFQYGLGSAYNSVAGYPAPVNPLPWKGQMPNSPNLNSVQALSP